MIILENDSSYVDITSLMKDIKKKLNRELFEEYLVKVARNTNIAFSGYRFYSNNYYRKMDNKNFYKKYIDEGEIDWTNNSKKVKPLDINFYYNVFTEEFVNEPVFGQTYLIYQVKFKKLMQVFKDGSANNFNYILIAF